MQHHSGSCLCGEISFVVEGELRDVLACHCTQCRKQTGHHYAATNAADDAIKIDGAEHLTWYQSSEEAKRGFCKHCGSALFWKPIGGDYTSILAGSFEKPTGLRISKHIFVADKGDYYEIKDGLPQTD